MVADQKPNLATWCQFDRHTQFVNPQEGIRWVAEARRFMQSMLTIKIKNRSRNRVCTPAISAFKFRSFTSIRYFCTEVFLVGLCMLTCTKKVKTQWLSPTVCGAKIGYVFRTLGTFWVLLSLALSERLWVSVNFATPCVRVISIELRALLAVRSIDIF